MATVADFEYALDVEPVVPWQNEQQPMFYSDEDYPFQLNDGDASPESHVQQTYLQFLWFPDSLMSLNLLVPALQRVQPGPSTSGIHPLHALLDPLLHTTRSASTKYRVDLSQILSESGGGGEIEEMTMWFSLNLEISEETGEGMWLDEGWRSAYLERMERREVQIQVLLYMLKLSLPGDFPPPPSPSKKEKGKRRQKAQQDPKQPTLATLEAFMDKLSTWQIMFFVQLADRQLNTSEKHERDWMQVFCEDIVEPLFKESLPDQCSLLRSKLFQDVPTDRDSDSSTTTAQPNPRPLKRSRTATTSRHPSPAIPSTSSRHPSPALPATASHARRQTTASSTLARSRSLSVSLAQEQEEQARSRQTMDKKKRALNREVSMSRKFKLPLKPTAPPTVISTKDSREKEEQEKERVKGKKKEKEFGMTLVEDTPVRSVSKGKAFEAEKFRSKSKKGPLFGVAPLLTTAAKKTTQSTSRNSASSSTSATVVEEEEEEDEVWTIKSSSHVVLLSGSGLGSDEDASGEEDDGAGEFGGGVGRGGVLDTPTKRRRLGVQDIPCLT